MRILAVGDMHGELHMVLSALARFPADLLLCCGDWGDPEEIARDVFDGILVKVPVLSVYGNHDDLELLAFARNVDGSPVLLKHGTVRELGRLRFAGIGGIWAKSHRKPYYITDEEVRQIAGTLAGQRVDVMLTHGCPIGLADTTPAGGRGGQRCFLDALHAVRPRVYLCGHLHLPQQRVLKDGRVIVNVGYTAEGDCWTFDINERNVEFQHHRLG